MSAQQAQHNPCRYRQTSNKAVHAATSYQTQSPSVCPRWAPISCAPPSTSWPRSPGSGRSHRLKQPIRLTRDRGQRRGVKWRVIRGVTKRALSLRGDWARQAGPSLPSLTKVWVIPPFFLSSVFGKKTPDKTPTDGKLPKRRHLYWLCFSGEAGGGRIDETTRGRGRKRAIER